MNLIAIDTEEVPTLTQEAVDAFTVSITRATIADIPPALDLTVLISALHRLVAKRESEQLNAQLRTNYKWGSTN